MDPIHTSGRCECHCGWAGEVPVAHDQKVTTCPKCGHPLPAPTATAESSQLPVNRVASASTPAGAIEPIATPARQSVVTTAWHWTRSQVRRIWIYIRSALAFYWISRGDLRTGLRRWFYQYLPALQDPDRVRREIRVPLREDERVAFHDEAWHIQLPGRCVICGSRGTGEQFRIDRQMLDAFPLLAVPLAGIPFSLFFGWWYQSLLLFLILLPLGLLGGYALRRIERVNVSFERCTRHGKSEKSPEVEMWHGDVLLWTGAREVRQAFFGQLVEETVPDGADAVYVPPEIVPSPPTETIALADDVPESSQIVHESANRLSSSESETDLFGALPETYDPANQAEQPPPGKLERKPTSGNRAPPFSET